MWTLTLWTTAITVLAIVLAYALHRWIGVRREVLGERWADLADTFWGRVWTWAKDRWDFTVAAVVALAPVVWSAGLDTIIIVANAFSNIIPAVAGLDLSSLMISDAHKAYIQIAAALLPPLRDAIEKLRS